MGTRRGQDGGWLTCVKHAWSAFISHTPHDPLQLFRGRTGFLLIDAPISCTVQHSAHSGVYTDWADEPILPSNPVLTSIRNGILRFLVLSSAYTDFDRWLSFSPLFSLPDRITDMAEAVDLYPTMEDPYNHLELSPTPPHFTGNADRMAAWHESERKGWDRAM